MELQLPVRRRKDAADDRAYECIFFLDAGTHLAFYSAVADGYQSYKGMKLNKDLAAKSAKVDTDLEALQTRKDAFTNKGRPADNIVIGGAPGQTSRPAHQTNNVNALKRGDTTQDPNNPLNPLTAQQEANLTMDAGEYDAINEKIDTKMRTLESNKETLTRTMQYNQTKYQTYGEIAKNTAKALSTGVQGYYMQDEGNQNNLATLENAKKDMSQQTASSAGGAVTQAANELASMLRDIRAASNPKA